MSGKKFFDINAENQPNSGIAITVVGERGRKELPPGTKGGENLKPDRHYEHKQYAFDSYCKKVLKCEVHTPPQEYSMTAEGGALVPREWCIHSGEMVHGGRRRGAPSRHAGAYSGRALRLRMDSPSIWIVYAL